MAKDHIRDYTVAAANNTDVDGVSIAEGTAPSNINDAIREVMAHQAELHGDTRGGLTSGGSGGAYTLTTNEVITTYAQSGGLFVFEANHAMPNTATASLNVDGVGAKPLRKDVSVALSQNDILANQMCIVAYEGTTDVFHLLSRGDSGLADLTGLAATDGNFIVGNGTTWVAESTATARTSLGLGSIATQAADNVSITGGSVTGITDVAVADGGTGSSTAGGARTNLGLGTIATQASNSVSITGGSITGITDLALADGGTAASTAADARSNLGAQVVWTYGAQTATTSGNTVLLMNNVSMANFTEIEILLSGVSKNGTGSTVGVRIGPNGGVETSGYVSRYVNNAGSGTATDRFVISDDMSASDTLYGTVRLVRWDSAEDLWILEGHTFDGGAAFMCVGYKTITGGELGDVALYSAVNFDAGEARVRYR